MGTITGVTALSLYMLDRYSSQPFYVNMIEMMYSLPVIAVFLFTGVFADQYDKQKIIVYSDILCFLISLLLCIAVSVEYIGLIFFLLFLRTAVTKFSPPSRLALIRSILTVDEFSFAMGYQQMILGILVMFGGGIGIVSYWVIGIKGAIFVDAISFLLSAFIVSRCRIDRRFRVISNPPHAVRMSLTSIWADFVEGVQYILKNTLLRGLFSGMFFIGAINGGANVMSLFIMKYKLAPSTYEEVQLLINIFTAIGIVFGCIIAPKLLRYMPNYKLFSLSFLLTGLVCFIQSFTQHVAIYLLLHIVFTLSIPLRDISYFGWIGRLIDIKMLGRFQAIVTPTVMLGYGITQILIGYFFPRFITVEFVFYFIGGLAFSLNLIFSYRLRKFTRNMVKINSQRMDG